MNKIKSAIMIGAAVLFTACGGVEKTAETGTIKKAE